VTISSRIIFTCFLFVFILLTLKKAQATSDKREDWFEMVSTFEIFEDTLDLPFDSIKILDAKCFHEYNNQQLKRNKIYWLRVVIDNSATRQQNNFIHFNSLFSSVKLYQKDENNYYIEKIGGSFVPEKKRSVGGYLKDKVPFRLSKGNKTELFIRIYTKVEKVYDLSQTEIISFDNYRKLNDRNYFLQYFFLGIIVILGLLNMTLFILTHKRLYLLYLLYIFSTTLYFVNFYQISEHYFLYKFPKLDLSLSISLTIAQAIYLWFLYEALKNEGIPKWRAFIRKSAIVVTVFCLIICSIIPFEYYYAIFLNDIYTLLNGTFIVIIFILLFRKVSLSIKIIIIGTFIMVICGLITLILDLSRVVSSNVILYQVGVFIEVILFSVALNFFYNNERLANIKAQLANSLLEVERTKKELENKNLTDKLTVQNCDLISKAIIISRKETIILDTEKRLISLCENEVLNNQKIKEVIKSLQVNRNDNWNEFELYLKKVHPGFYSELIKKYPYLTRNDIKLCAFIKLNLSTKQIAEINGKSQNTIDVARHRLRKKMGLQNGTLTSFIASIG